MTSTEIDLLVVGGGAAGLWAAGTAAARGKHVVVIERNRKPGVKILMSGGTRCNITHHCGIDGIIKAFGKRQGRFLKPALHELAPEMVVREVNQLGVSTKVEETGKVFPVSDRALDVRDALVRRLRAQGAELRPGVSVDEVAYSEGESQPWRVATSEGERTAKNLLLCCGGLSYPGCGTQGDGYGWARKLGHEVVDTSPALTPLRSDEDWSHALSGLTLPDVQASVQNERGKVSDPRQTSRGGFLWTHFGCSGPVPMNLSRFIVDGTTEDRDGERRLGGAISLRLDFMPGVAEEQLLAQLSANQGGKRKVVAQVQQWLPKRLAAVLCERAKISDGTILAELNKKSRQHLLTDLKRMALPISGTRGYAKAEVTRGGVSLAEVNPQTMQSRKIPSLYFAGEILDIDGPIGGFNFQAAFSTGHMVGLKV